jgi:CRP/FNR family transcriptional regulator
MALYQTLDEKVRSELMNTSPQSSPHATTFSCNGCRHCAELFSGIPAEDHGSLTQWLQESKTICYERGDKIVHIGMPAFGVYLVCNGVVKLVQQSDTHKEQIIKVVGPGEFLGEENLLGDQLFAYYAEAMEPV